MEKAVVISITYRVAHHGQCLLRRVWCKSDLCGMAYEPDYYSEAKAWGVSPPRGCSCAPTLWTFLPLSRLEDRQIMGNARVLWALFQRWGKKGEEKEVNEDVRLGRFFHRASAQVLVNYNLPPWKYPLHINDLQDGPIKGTRPSHWALCMPNGHIPFQTECDECWTYRPINRGREDEGETVDMSLPGSNAADYHLGTIIDEIHSIDIDEIHSNN